MQLGHYARPCVSRIPWTILTRAASVANTLARRCSSDTPDLASSTLPWASLPGQPQRATVAQRGITDSSLTARALHSDLASGTLLWAILTRAPSKATVTRRCGSGCTGPGVSTLPWTICRAASAGYLGAALPHGRRSCTAQVLRQRRVSRIPWAIAPRTTSAGYLGAALPHGTLMHSSGCTRPASARYLGCDLRSDLSGLPWRGAAAGHQTLRQRAMDDPYPGSLSGLPWRCAYSTGQLVRSSGTAPDRDRHAMGLLRWTASMNCSAALPSTQRC
jgi:hypothetical protein